ncbi:hypothetical protein LINGRAPRIM_LOCUS3255 [Linum grandiflorum]
MLLRAITDRKKLKDFPSCFGESGVQVADSSSASSKSAQHNLVTCVYHCKLRRLPCFITVTWSKTLMGQGLGIAIDNSFHQCLCRVDIKPWLFSKRKGLKTLQVDSDRIDIYWDVSSAKFSGSGPEPLQGFYLAVGFNREIVLLLGDLRKEACRKFETDRAILRSNSSNAVFVAKKEHIFGKKFYGAKTQFFGDGQLHDVGIECDSDTTTTVDHVKDHCLVIKVDGKVVMQVKRLKWKFRGNGTILVDGLPVEVFWDVHDWLFGGAAMGNNNAVFMFQTCLSAEKLWNSSSSSQQPLFDLSTASAMSQSQRFKECQSQGLGFSLVLYAWKNDKL